MLQMRWQQILTERRSVYGVPTCCHIDCGEINCDHHELAATASLVPFPLWSAMGTQRRHRPCGLEYHVCATVEDYQTGMDRKTPFLIPSFFRVKEKGDRGGTSRLPFWSS